MTDDDLIRRGDAYDAVRNTVSMSDALDAIAALPAVTPATQPDEALIAKREYLLLASYCGGDEGEECTDAKPCAACLAMCNIFTQGGTYLRQLGTVHVPKDVNPALHRSFPEAGDGRPMPPMGDELMIAGLGAEDARFVAVQLAQNGWTLTPSQPRAAALKPPFSFERYINGVLMAEGVTIERQANFSDAAREASRIASRGPNGEVPVLVLTQNSQSDEAPK